MKEENKKILSICIPTNGAVNWVIPTLESIYCQDFDHNQVDVIVTDNSEKNDLEKEIQSRNYINLKYYRTKDSGFINLISCLKKGDGLYCKMLNHRSILRNGIIKSWIGLIEQYSQEQPVIYMSDGNLKLNKSIKCNTLDEFLYNLSYWCSWSAGIGIWQKDKVLLDSIEYNEMFPNLSLLTEIGNDSRYLIWDEKYQDMQDDSGKGGYNIYKVFGVDFLDIINNLRVKSKISLQTFLKIKKDIKLFLFEWNSTLLLFRNKYTFDKDNKLLYLSVYYNKYTYLIMYLYIIVSISKRLLRKISRYLK